MRHLATVGDVLKCNQPLLEATLKVVRNMELRLPLAMRHGHRQARTGHTCQQHRRLVRDPHQTEARLELLAAVAQESGPVLRARNQFPEQCKHLAAVAHAK